jgi:hypothetical protein
MYSQEHMELLADVLNKFKIFQEALFNHFDKLVKDGQFFDLEDEAERFKSNSQEGVQLINAQKKLDKFKREHLSQTEK